MKIRIKKQDTLFDVLLEEIGSASATRVRKLIKHGGVNVGGKTIRRTDHMVFPGQTVEVSHPVPDTKSLANFHIIHEDEFLIAAEKPSGLLSIASDREKIRTFYRDLSDYVHETQNGKIFIVHRLDREVSGVMVFAKNKDVQKKLQENWSSTTRTYCALVEGCPPEEKGRIEGWLKENRIHKVYSCPDGPYASKAVTTYRKTGSSGSYSLLEIGMETNCKDQIRAHLSEIGCPVAGDRKYGAKGSPVGRLALHLSMLSLDHPDDNRRLKLTSPVPKRFKTALRHQGDNRRRY